MSDLRDAIQLEMRSAGVPTATFDDLGHRRDGRRRTRRISAGVVGVAVFTIVVTAIGSSVLRSEGPPEPLPAAPVANNGSMTWASEDAILMESADPSNPTVLWTNPAGGRWKIGSFDWSPDGTRIAIATIEPLPQTSLPCRLYVFDVASGSSTELADCQHAGWGAQIADWSPDGSSIVYSGPGGIRRIGADGSDPVKLTLGGGDPSWSPAGRIAYVTVDRQRIVSMASDGSDPIVLTAAGSERYGIISPAWSPDGTRIAYLHAEDHPGYPAGVAGGTGLWIADADGSNAVRVAGMECCIGASEAFGWSPDGTELVWTGTKVIFIEADGSGLETYHQGSGAGLLGLDMSVRPSWRPVP